MTDKESSDSNIRHASRGCLSVPVSKTNARQHTVKCKGMKYEIFCHQTLEI